MELLLLFIFAPTFFWILIGLSALAAVTSRSGQAYSPPRSAPALTQEQRIRACMTTLLIVPVILAVVIAFMELTK